MARGLLGVKRLSDALPFVSEHREPASDCAKELCFNGMEKSDVFANVEAAFISHKNNFKQFLDDRGVEVERIAIVGSLARGDFGCRSMERLDRELDGVAIRLSNEGKATKEERNKMFELFEESSTQRDFYNKVDEQIENEAMLNEIINFMCSDIDIVAVTPLSQIALSELDREYGFTDAVESNIESHLSPVEIFASDEIDTPSLSTEQDFKAILRRHY